ncbi:MAG TPA: exodeoxyribonuclease VII small subunit [Edaphobacter sp.]|nr:exodeoxyribonuclease VII small subunit [Edaphobacter sp.]
MASFEEQLTALETVVERLERGELSLEESVSLFEEGVRLSNSCKKQLEAAEGRIQVLVEPEGRAVRMTDLEIEDEDLDVEADEDEE